MIQPTRLSILFLLMLGSSSSLLIATDPPVTQPFEQAKKVYSAAAFGDLINIKSHVLFKKQAGCRNKNIPDILLLSGPTDHWHSDSGWFSLLQPILGQTKCVWALDRPGHGFSPTSDDLSYLSFGSIVNQVAQQQKWQAVTVVAFASSNISLNQMLTEAAYTDWIKGAILIDPDILLPHSIAQYSNDAKPFKDNLTKYREYITAGKYSQRAAAIAEKEQQHVEQIIPANYQNQMDWAYYRAIAAQRQTVDRLLARFTELSVYQQDLEQAAQLTIPSSLPLVIINTDFEASFIESNDDNQRLIQWRDEGNRWMEQLSKGKHRKYVPLTSREHLLPISNPEIISDAIDWLEAQTK